MNILDALSGWDLTPPKEVQGATIAVLFLREEMCVDDAMAFSFFLGEDWLARLDAVSHVHTRAMRYMCYIHTHCLLCMVRAYARATRSPVLGGPMRY